METNTPKQTALTQPQQQVRRPDETGAITVTGQVRIFDPQSQQIFVEKQG